MADNFSAGGTTFSSDDLAGVHVTRNKIMLGANGADDGTVASGNPLPVILTGTNQVATVSTVTTVATVTNVGTVAAVTAISNALPAGTNNIGDVDILSVVPGTGATNLGKAEDAVASGGDVGVLMLGIRDDSNSLFSCANGDYGALRLDSDRNLCVSMESISLDDALSVDDTTFNAESDSCLRVGMVAYSTGVDSASSGDIAVPRITTDRKQVVVIEPHTIGGLSSYRKVAAGSYDVANIKASAGQLYNVSIASSTTSVYYVHLYNVSGSPTTGSDTPVFSFVAGANQNSNAFQTDIGVAFSSGIGISINTTPAPNGGSGAAASDIVVNVTYK